MERERSLEFFMSSSPIHETQESERAVEGERPIEEVVDGQAEQGGEEEEDHEDNVQEQEAFIVSERILPQKYCYPKYTPYRDRIREEKKFYFTNNRTLAPFESKLPQGTQPFFAEDSGLYAGRRPQVTIGNLAAMENRLLQRPDKGEGWFGKDGLLLTTFKPLKELITRPLIVLEDGGQHHYKPYQIPKVADGNKRYVKSDGAIHQCILELFLGSMSFGHHPMYSLEHVLSGVMERLCTEYNQIDRERVINQHRQKLQALQISAWNLRQKLSELQKSMQSQPSGQLQKELTTSKMHLNHYNIEIRFTRQSIKQMAAAEYRLTQNILEKWREIKTLRNEQGYVCTDVELTVHKVETDAANEQIQLERDIECELHEMREDYESSIEEEMRQYAARLNEWKMHEKERRKIVRQMTNQSFQAPSPEVEDEKENVPETEGGTSQSSSAVMPPHKSPKPVAPPPFDEEGARQGLVDYYRHSHRRPGYPRLIPHLTHNHHITQHVPKEEQRRREAIRHMRYKIKVLYNDKEVYTTSEKHHEGHSFTITFNELLNINIVEIPNTIELQIHIMGSLFSFSDVVKVYIPVPDSGVTSSYTHCDPYQFSSNHPVSYTHHTGVGSGHIHPNYPQGGELTTSGHIAVAICWSEGPDGQPLCPANIKKEKLDQLSYIGVAGINSAYKLKKWIEEAHIDPNDPRNWDILELIESLPDTCEEPKYFRLMKMDKDAQFVEKEEFDNNRRFVLLKMRSQGHPALKGFSIPLNEDCITDSLWKSVCDHKPHGLADLPVSIFGNFYEGKRSIRLQYLNEVRQKVLERSGTHPTTELTLDDIITKDTIPTISSLRNTLVNLFSPHRPLRPKRIVRRKPKPLNVHVTSCHVTVRVVMAINVPLREGHEGRRDKCPVKSFVRIQFGKETARTETAYGPHPHWNEELVLPFHPPDDDFSPAALLKVSDDLILHLYDEVMVNMITDERQKDSDIHMKIEKKWLGSLTIPFSTLHSHSRIEGTFQLDTPPIILGYDWTPPSQNLVEDSSKTFLQLFISLEPPLSTLPPITDRVKEIPIIPFPYFHSNDSIPIV
jgi:coiled-coil and C2 domain-containing protein 2A